MAISEISPQSTRGPGPDGPAGHGVDVKLPWRLNATFAIQHVLLMYAGCVAVPLAFGAAMDLDQETIALLINADLLVAGIITIIQSLGVGRIMGVRLPVIGGATFVQMATIISIGQQYGIFTEVRGLGLLLGCVLSDAWKGKAKAVLDAAALEGVMVLQASPDVVRFAPSLVVEDADIDEGLKRFERAVRQLTA